MVISQAHHERTSEAELFHRDLDIPILSDRQSVSHCASSIE